MSSENPVIGCTYLVRGTPQTVVHVEPMFNGAGGNYREEQVVTRNSCGVLTTWRSDEFMSVARLCGRQETYGRDGTYIGRYDYRFVNPDGTEKFVTFDVYADWGLITKDLARSLRNSKVGRSERMRGAIRAKTRN